jgi:type II secretory pathway predicted ATPase ExeA
MYHAHFGLSEEPFGASPDPHFFFRTEQHHEAVATLFYAIQQRRGFAMLVGRAGLGKTSVLFTLVQSLKDKAEVVYLPNPYYDRTTILEAILGALGLEPVPSAAGNHRLFYEYLAKTHRSGRTCVVVLDEAQGLNRDTLEAIRMLSNFETPTEKLVQIILAGQPRLAETLKQPDCEQIRQRLSAVARLNPLSGSEVYDYMAHRLKIATGSTGLFTREALEAIASASAGVPRNVNTICFNSLTLAYALNKRQVGCVEVAEVLRDLDLPPEEALPRPARVPESIGAALSLAPGIAYLATTPTFQTYLGHLVERAASPFTWRFRRLRPHSVPPGSPPA